MKGFPGSLLALDLWVRKHAQEVKSIIIDEEDTPHSDLKDSLTKKLADAQEHSYIGITSTTATYQDAILTAQFVKQIKPRSTVILGGHHVNGQEQVVLKHHPEIDLVVTGEGEKALVGILNGNYSTPGIHRRTKEFLTSLPNSGGKALRLTASELSSLDIRDFDQAHMIKSTQFGETNLVTARGCPMKCAFCSVANETTTTQDPDLVVDQIDFIVQQNKSRSKSTIIAIQDNFFAQNPVRAREIARKLIDYKKRSGNTFQWNMQTRVEQFADSQLAAILAQAGCTAAYFGVENFDSRMLKMLNKAHNQVTYIQMTSQAIKNCLENGIQPHIDFQVGIPDEDTQTEQINAEALQQIGEIAKKYEIKPIVFPSLSVVYPETSFYNKMMSLGTSKEIYEIFTLWERENPEYRQALHGYFAHGNGGIPLGIIDTSKLKIGEISIIQESLQRVKSYLDRLREIPGIIVHNYLNERRENV